MSAYDDWLARPCEKALEDSAMQQDAAEEEFDRYEHGYLSTAEEAGFFAFSDDATHSKAERYVRDILRDMIGNHNWQIEQARLATIECVRTTGWEGFVEIVAESMGRDDE